MRVAASSPAWLTRRAESRNFFWATVRGLVRFGGEVDFRFEGSFSSWRRRRVVVVKGRETFRARS